MASPDPAVEERNYWLAKLGIPDDPNMSLSDLRDATGGGANAHRAVKVAPAGLDQQVSTIYSDVLSQLRQLIDAQYTKLPAAAGQPYNIYYRDGANIPGWTTSEEVVARALGWKVSNLVPDAGITDHTAGLTAFIASLNAGETGWLKPTSSAKWYTQNAKITFTNPNTRLTGGGGRDYACQIKGAAGITMYDVKATGVVIDKIMLVGNGGTNGAGATTNGIDYYGDTDANVDATVGCNILGMAVGTRVRGRNALIMDASFTNCKKGIVFEGKDVVYHTGPNADDNRGNWVTRCRFHNVGAAATDAAIEVTSTSKMLHGIFADNFFDSNGLGKHFLITGTNVDPIKGIFINNNKHTECGADVYSLTWVQNSQIHGADMQGYVGAGPTYGRGMVFSNCTDIDVADIRMLQMGQHGLFGTDNTRIRLRNIKLRALGQDPGNVADGFNFDSTNTDIDVDDIYVNVTDGYGWNGSPTNSRLGKYTFESCTAGRFNSTVFTDENIWIPASDFFAITGTPVLAGLQGVGYPQGMLFDPAATEQACSSALAIPENWVTFDAYLVWAPTTTLGGNVVYDMSWGELIPGAVPATGAAQSRTVAAPTTTAQIVNTLMNSGVARTFNQQFFRFDRAGANGSDTYAADTNVLGVKLIRTL